MILAASCSVPMDAHSLVEGRTRPFGYGMPSRVNPNALSLGIRVGFAAYRSVPMDAHSLVEGATRPFGYGMPSRVNPNALSLGHTDWVNSISFSPDGSTLASASTDIRLWDATTGAPKHTLTGHTGGVYSLVFSPDGQTLASGGQETIRLWDAVTGAHKRTLTRHTNWWINSVSFSPDGRTLASASGQRKYGNPLDDIIWLWDAVTGERKHTLTGHTDWISSVSFSPDGQTLASAGADIRLWDAITGCTETHSH